ncbi:MAG TPA: DUF4180 domain-containing protein [Roseiflexaceae bacterium]|nr:DUF4180 domain-containing protein [Roseiflexaceae bacterium]
MKLQLVNEQGMRLLEGAPNAPLLSSPYDIDRIIEACFADHIEAVLLYTANLTPTFFDLSSGDAGVVLQKLQNYRIRLAIVAPREHVRFSRRFSEMLADNQQGIMFGVFEDRSAAALWLVVQHNAASASRSA